MARRIKTARGGGVAVGSADLAVMPVRPPAVPDAARHAVNLAHCGLSLQALAEWLGVTVEDIAEGKTAAIRAAVAWYCDWRGRALLARAR